MTPNMAPAANYSMPLINNTGLDPTQYSIYAVSLPALKFTGETDGSVFHVFNPVGLSVLTNDGIHGAGFVPPPATGTFTDVPASSSFAPWIEQLSNDGTTGGCATSPLQYCPDASVTRGQMAVFLVRTFNLPM
jgi:hypothetical protein